MSKKIARYIFSKRRRWGLGQQELAYLIGLKSGSNVSRLESGKRRPTIETAFAYQVLFGSTAAELLPELYSKVEDALMRRAYKLHEKLKGDESKEAQVKRQLLQATLTRAKKRSENNEA
jgi:transcriptional regulator with XRE-family HTH domain